MPVVRQVKYYAVRYPNDRHRGSYSLTGRRCLVRTFGSEAERDAYVAAQPDRNSVLFDGERTAVPATTLLTENGRLCPIAEAVPGI